MAAFLRQQMSWYAKTYFETNSAEPVLHVIGLVGVTMYALKATNAVRVGAVQQKHTANFLL